ncbi:hypothetical protein [Corynebacterium pseudopelargi]|uniref:Uncharacterized protein n=1 Tax=Corynebacterium pseudopelargi TaxID=2080757 RepID=A0A3G6IVM4_9CORY|nr:hypothetical protein [Corynebacterium pseudopelargi]AZA09697.1 hypothetical protein CPPEL_07945 [Corynebacterium pseudopelargi]
MQKWIPAALLLLLAQLIAMYSLDGSASYTISVGAALVLTALTFAWAPPQARRALLIGTIFFAAYVGARLDATPAKVLITLVLCTSTAWSLYRGLPSGWRLR